MDNSDQEMGNELDHCTPEEESATTDTVHEEEARESAETVHCAHNHGDFEGVVEPCGLEEGGTIVEDEVYPGDFSSAKNILVGEFAKGGGSYVVAKLA
jgi:hypothetical protein